MKNNQTPPSSLGESIQLANLDRLFKAVLLNDSLRHQYQKFYKGESEKISKVSKKENSDNSNHAEKVN